MVIYKHHLLLINLYCYILMQVVRCSQGLQGELMGLQPQLDYIAELSEKFISEDDLGSQALTLKAGVDSALGRRDRASKLLGDTLAEIEIASDSVREFQVGGDFNSNNIQCGHLINICRFFLLRSISSRRSFEFAAPTIWNGLLAPLRFRSSISIFCTT